MVYGARIARGRRGPGFNRRRTQAGASRSDTGRRQTGALTKYVADMRRPAPRQEPTMADSGTVVDRLTTIVDAVMRAVRCHGVAV